MTVHHGSESKFSCDDSGGTLRDLSAYVEKVNESFTRAMHNSTTIGNASGANTYVPGLRDGKFTVDVFWDPTATTGPDAVLHGDLNVPIGTTTSVEYGPEGGTTGDVKYTCEALLESYDTTVVATDLTKGTATFQITGAVTRGTFA
jgi:hypothetical protein